MSRTQYLKSLEREVSAATKIINELTKENYELRKMLEAPTRIERDETKSREQVSV